MSGPGYGHSRPEGRSAKQPHETPNPKGPDFGHEHEMDEHGRCYCGAYTQASS